VLGYCARFPEDVEEMIGHSYELVVAKLPRAERERLAAIRGAD
jgi:predicted DNA-binding protein (MmcQ/YjbR family)